MIEVIDYNIVKSIFKDWKHDMVFQSIELGNTVPRLWVDDEQNPSMAIILTGIKMRIKGFPQNEEKKKDIVDFFTNIVLQGKIETIKNEILIFWFENEWEFLLSDIFKGRNMWLPVREYYEEAIENINFNDCNYDFEIIDAVSIVLGEQKYEYIQDLRNEMCSETPSVEDFAKYCFGLVAIKDNKIIGWCMSEYNNSNGCEIGIGVNEAYRRKGIATILGQNLINEAKKRGYNTIGWSCFKKNIPSVKTALKLGLNKVKEYKMIYVEW